jgi:hypothetical protein
MKMNEKHPMKMNEKHPMKMNEKMFAVMREAASLLQKNGAGTATGKISGRLLHQSCRHPRLQAVCPDCL